MEKENSSELIHGVDLVKMRLQALVDALASLNELEKEEVFPLIDNALKNVLCTKPAPKNLDLCYNSFLPKSCPCNEKDPNKKLVGSDKIYDNFNCSNAIESTSGQEVLACSQITIPDNFFNLPETAYKVSDFPENLHYEGLEKELEKLESYTPYLDLSQKNADSRSSLLASFEKTKSSYKEEEVAILDLCSRDNSSQFKNHWRNMENQQFPSEEVVSIQVNPKDVEATNAESIEISVDDLSKEPSSEFTSSLELRSYTDKSTPVLPQCKKDSKFYSTERISENILALEKMFPKELNSRSDIQVEEKLDYMVSLKKTAAHDSSTGVDDGPFLLSVDQQKSDDAPPLDQEALNLVNRREGSESSAQKNTEELVTVSSSQEQLNASVSEAQAPVSCRSCKCELKDVSLFNEHQVKCCKSFCCIYCNVTYTNKVHFAKHISAHKRNTCQHCSVTFTIFKELKRHMKLVHYVDLAGKTYPCTFCERVFLKKFSLFYHYQTHTQSEQKVCLRCGKFLQNETLFDEHMKDHIEKSLKCTICNQIFMRAQQLQSHIKTHEKYKCDHCEKSFASKIFLHKHSLLEHHQKPKHIEFNSARYICDECGKSFNRPSLLNIHLKIHLGERPLECRICDKSYDSPRSLMKHLKSLTHEYKSLTSNPSKKSEILSTATSLFPCEYCEMSMPSMRLLEVHCSISHKKGITQTCNHCDFKTNKKSLYKKHRETHRERKFICEVCGKAFLSHARLKDHNAFVHSDERNFKCSSCMKSFKNKSTLVRHTKTHLLERPHKCPCGAAFKEVFHLKRHKQATHVDSISQKKRKAAETPVKSSRNAKEQRICIVEGETAERSQNDYVVTPISAVVMSGEPSINNESAHYAVLGSQLIQFVPSTVPAAQEGLHTVSLVGGELHTLSIPSYQVPQSTEQTFIPQNIEHNVLTPHQVPFQQLAITHDMSNPTDKVKDKKQETTPDMDFPQNSTETIATFSYPENDEPSSANTDFLAAAIRQQTINQDFEIMSDSSFFC